MVVHRDLKPSNVLLAPDGPRVIDFGIARAVEGTAVTRTGMRVGSPQFMAPEQIAGQSITPAIDVFALGALATFAALGRPPFGEGGEAAVMYRILHEPPDLGGCAEPLRGVIERCLAKQAAGRPEPAEIIGECRVHTAGQTLEIAQSWLPAAVAAVLGDHVVAPAPPAPGLPPPAVAPADGAKPPADASADGAKPSGPDAPTAYPPGQAPTAQPPGPDAPTAYPPPPAPAGVAAAGAMPLPAAGPAGTQALQPGGAPGPRRWSRAALIGGAGAAAVVIAAVAVGATLLVVRGQAGGTGAGGQHGHGSGTSGSHHTGTSAAQGTGPSAGQAGGRSTPATPQPALPPDLDRCMIGVWKGVNESVTNQINGQPVPFIGPGATQTFRPNGRAKAYYGKSAVYRATVNGNAWTYVFHGYVNTGSLTLTRELPKPQPGS